MIPCLLLAALSAVPEWSFDRAGRLVGVSADGEAVAIHGNVRLPNRGWGRQPSLDDLRDGKQAADGQVTRWQGQIEAVPGGFASFDQTLAQDGDQVVVTVKVTAEADLDLEGVFYWLDYPIAAFAGGTCDWSGGAQPARVDLPLERPASRHLQRADAKTFTVRDRPGRTQVTVSFDRALNVAIQDNREYGGQTYTALVRLSNALKRGESAAATITFAAELEPDRTPANLRVEPGVTRYAFDGFGGNYCFNIESPVTDYTLNHLKIAWARTEMTPYEWEPRNENDDPAATDWDALAARDQPDTNLRRELLLAQRIQQMGVPYVISVWQLPNWLYADPEGDPRAGRRKIAPDKWPELLECLGSYLLYAKRQYGVEPDLFSFNESDIGVRVWLTAEEHRDAIKRLGAHFEQLGLRTKLLLGDTGNARGTHKFCLPTADDPEALKYVGAVSFHSWGGASAEQYNAWADLAERLKLPLLVGELGVDPGAWSGGAYATFEYALREVQHYQEILLHARPRGTMQWEFTSDYSTVAVDGDRLTPTKRFYFVQQFCNLTPQRSRALGVGSDHPRVFVTAFASDTAAAVHIANLGAARQATLTGLPAGTWRAIRTSAEDDYASLPVVENNGGPLTLELAAQSLLTLFQ